MDFLHLLPECLSRQIVLLLDDSAVVHAVSVSKPWRSIVTSMVPVRVTISARPMELTLPPHGVNGVPPAPLARNESSEMAVVVTSHDTGGELEEIVVAALARPNRPFARLSVSGTCINTLLDVLPLDMVTKLGSLVLSPLLSLDLPPTPLARFSSLRFLTMCRVSHCRMGDCSNLLPLLESLHLSHCVHVTGLDRLPKLQSLALKDVADRSSLSVVPHLTQLTGLTLLRMGSATDVCRAVTTLTSLLSLSLAPSLCGTDEECQHAIDGAAQRLSSLLRLHLLVQHPLLMPPGWSHVPRLSVMSTTVLPSTSRTTRLVVRENRRLSPTPFFVLPVGLTHLHANYKTIRLALHCSALTDLVCTSGLVLTSNSGNHDEQSFLVSVRDTAWRRLRSASFVPEAHALSDCDREVRWATIPDIPSFGCDSSKELETNALQHARVVEKLVAALSSRVHGTISHLTLFPRFRYVLSDMHLTPMRTLSSMTIVGMHVQEPAMLILVRMPMMRTVELVDVTGISREACRKLLLRAHVRVRVVFRQLSALLSSETCVMAMDAVV